MTSINLVRIKAYYLRIEFWITITKIEISYKVGILKVLLMGSITEVIPAVIFLIFEEEISIMIIRIIKTD